MIFIKASNFENSRYVKAEVCCFVYKFFHNKLPNCFEGSFTLNSSVHCRSPRRADNIRLPLVKKSICHQSILFTGSKHWNEIPRDIKNCRSLHSFKINLKKIFYWTLLNIIVWISFIVMDILTDWLFVSLIANTCRLAYSNFFNWSSLCDFFLCYYFFVFVLAGSMYHLFLRGAHRSTLGLSTKPAAISIIRAFVIIIILCFCSPNKSTRTKTVAIGDFCRYS